MRYEERNDGELVELARAGWAPAFAVLIHRHGPALLAAFADEPDPHERVVDVLVRAMRQVPERDPDAPVAPWLFALAGRPEPSTVPPVDEAELDRLWREVAALWPDGRHIRRRRPRPVLWAAVTVVGSVALGVAVPTIVLGIPAVPDDEPPPSVRAQPLEDEEPEPPEPEDLPDFEFPDLGDTRTPPTGQAPADPIRPPAGPSVPSAPAPTDPSPPPVDDAPGTPPDVPIAPPADDTGDDGGAGDGSVDGATDDGGPVDGGDGTGGDGAGGGAGGDGGAGDDGDGDGGAADGGTVDGGDGAAGQALATNGAW